jgi:hypothetical protein
MLGRQRDRGAQLDHRGDSGRHAQRDPRIKGPQVPVIGQGGAPGTRVSGLAPHRDMGVLGDIEAVEPGRLGGLSGLGRADPSVTGEQDDAVSHRRTVTRSTS